MQPSFNYRSLIQTWFWLAPQTKSLAQIQANRAEQEHRSSIPGDKNPLVINCFVITQTFLAEVRLPSSSHRMKLNQGHTAREKEGCREDEDFLKTSHVHPKHAYFLYWLQSIYSMRFLHCIAWIIVYYHSVYSRVVLTFSHTKFTPVWYIRSHGGKNKVPG